MFMQLNLKAIYDKWNIVFISILYRVLLKAFPSISSTFLVLYIAYVLVTYVILR